MNYKRWIAAGAVAAMAAGGAFAFADTLSGLGTSHLGAKDVAVSGCSSTITATYQTAWSGPATPGGASGFVVTGVILTVGTAANPGNCVGGTASVELTGSTPAGVGLAGGSTGATTLVAGPNPVIGLNPTAPAITLPDPTNVTDISVVVSGP